MNYSRTGLDYTRKAKSRPKISKEKVNVDYLTIFLFVVLAVVILLYFLK